MDTKIWPVLASFDTEKVQSSYEVYIVKSKSKSDPVKSKTKSSQTQSNPILELDMDLTRIGFGASLALTMFDQK